MMYLILNKALFHIVFNLIDIALNLWYSNPEFDWKCYARGGPNVKKINQVPQILF